MNASTARAIVAEGQVIVFSTGFPVDPDREHIVKPKCDKLSGLWACVTHKLVHKNNLSASIHEDGPGGHLVVWLCDEHGPEVP